MPKLPIQGAVRDAAVTPREIQQLRDLLVAALLLVDGYLVEHVGTREDVTAAPEAIVAILATVADQLRKKRKAA